MQISRIRLSLRLHHAAIAGHIAPTLPYGRASIFKRRDSSVSGHLSKRHSSLLTPRVQGKAPWLHGHYPASSLLWASPTPDTAINQLFIPGRCWRTSHHVGSPRFLDATVRARPPLSPRGALRLHTLVALPQVTGFIMSGRLATPICVTRPNRVHLR